MHFSEIIKLHIGKKNAIHCLVNLLFSIISVASLSLKNAEKSELSKCSWYLKRKFGVTMHFSEIIKLQIGKNAIHCLVFYCFL